MKCPVCKRKRAGGLCPDCGGKPPSYSPAFCPVRWLCALAYGVIPLSSLLALAAVAGVLFSQDAWALAVVWPLRLAPMYWLAYALVGLFATAKLIRLRREGYALLVTWAVMGALAGAVPNLSDCLFRWSIDYRPWWHGAFFALAAGVVWMSLHLWYLRKRRFLFGSGYTLAVLRGKSHSRLIPRAAEECAALERRLWENRRSLRPGDVSPAPGEALGRGLSVAWLKFFHFCLTPLQILCSALLLFLAYQGWNLYLMQGFYMDMGGYTVQKAALQGCLVIQVLYAALLLAALLFTLRMRKAALAWNMAAVIAGALAGAMQVSIDSFLLTGRYWGWILLVLLPGWCVPNLVYLWRRRALFGGGVSLRELSDRCRREDAERADFNAWLERRHPAVQPVAAEEPVEEHRPVDAAGAAFAEIFAPAGQPVSGAASCPVCGMPLREDAAACAYCGRMAQIVPSEGDASSSRCGAANAPNPWTEPGGPFAGEEPPAGGIAFDLTEAPVAGEPADAAEYPEDPGQAFAMILGGKAACEEDASALADSGVFAEILGGPQTSDREEKDWRFCMECGKPLVPGGRFCAFCGQKLPSASGEGAVGPQSAGQPKA